MTSQSWREFFRHIHSEYGITETEYRVLYYAQGGTCYVDRTSTGPTKRNPTARRLGVDHNHLTGEVRGLVCTGSLTANTCNRLIAIYERPQLIRAVEMLSDPPPARAVLAALRSGQITGIPSLIPGNPAFDLSDVKGVSLP